MCRIVSQVYTLCPDRVLSTYFPSKPGNSLKSRVCHIEYWVEEACDDTETTLHDKQTKFSSKHKYFNWEDNENNNEKAWTADPRWNCRTNDSSRVRDCFQKLKALDGFEEFHPYEEPKSRKEMKRSKQFKHTYIHPLSPHSPQLKLNGYYETAMGSGMYQVNLDPRNDIFEKGKHNDEMVALNRLMAVKDQLDEEFEIENELGDTPESRT
ncbi:hypothetical protein HYALB_00011175 [Hymenoscyphus albidus]|uniref:Uncharacterized protein n=1 Tax=Hymenoscyphus albidus TaxID=595503 RepID=A0A9N9LP27_9HELO|nr:hypothetical protein HYALB_00011175 [Hymenoscyphus albidus]